MPPSRTTPESDPEELLELDEAPELEELEALEDEPLVPVVPVPDEVTVPVAVGLSGPASRPFVEIVVGELLQARMKDTKAMVSPRNLTCCRSESRAIRLNRVTDEGEVRACGTARTSRPGRLALLQTVRARPHSALACVIAALVACDSSSSGGGPDAGAGGSNGTSGPSDSSGEVASSTGGDDGGSRAVGSSSGGGSSASGSSSASSPGACTNSEQAVPAADRAPNGHPLLPPKWAFGVLWGTYYDQTGYYAKSAGVKPPDPVTLTDAAAKLRNEYAGDMIWVDSTWLYHVYGSTAAATGAYYLCFNYDSLTFPDPVAMIQGLRALHFHYGTWTWPWMGHGCSHFDEAVNNKYFVMNGAAPALAAGGWHGDPTPAAFDFTNPATATWWQALMQPYTSAGQDFFKLDTDQTQVMSWQGSGGRLSDPTEDYVYEYHRTEYEASKLYAAANDANAMLNGARGFIMPKQHAPGNDQIPGWWTDDIPATWAGMQTEMGRAAALDTPDTAAYWCGDTGGYSGPPPTDELYARWLEYSAFTPLQEFFGARDSAGSIGARWPWLFSAESQAIQKEYASLRYRLLPFRYSNAQAAYHGANGVYPVRWVGDKQIISGDGTSDILVQPISAPGQTTTSVPLPAGSNWIHYWTGASFAGGRTATVATPVDQAAIFVKAGSIIPMGPDLRYVDEIPADPLTLDIYPAGSTSYTLYEDDGISEGYLGGAYSTTGFHADDTSGHVAVSIDAQVTAKYTYAGQVCSRGYSLEIHGQATAPAGVTRDGNVVMPLASSTSLAAAAEGYYYDQAAQIVWVKFELDSSQATRVSLM